MAVVSALHSRHPMFLWWGKDLVQFYNDAYLPSFGAGKHPAAMGQRGRDCWGEIGPIIWPQIDDVMSRGVASWNEDALVPILRNGRLEDVYCTYGYSPVFDDDGGVGGTLVVVTETTARVLAERALIEMSESLATTLDSIGEGVIATDLSGAVVRMNPVAESLTGWTIAEAKGRPVAELLRLVDEDTRAPVESQIARTLRDGVPVGPPSRTLFRRRDGTEIAIGESSAPIRSSAGAIRGAVVVFRDLTAARDAEAIRLQLQNQLIAADRMASVGTLAAGFAHEINNLLRYVSASVELAIEGIRSLARTAAPGSIAEREHALVEAREGAARITKIVRGMKTFSRIDEERRGVVDLVPVLELAVTMAFNEIRHRARLVKEYGRLPLVDADDARLGQVFINLLVNATQAMTEGDAETNEIRIVTSTDASGAAVVEIRDTGPGIAPETLLRVFDPFFTTKPVGVGPGLGLAICHNTVAAMGGKISVASELGRGTTFRVVLPPSRSAARPEIAAAVVEPTSIRSGCVLVVDDEPSVGVALRRVLRVTT